MSLGECNTWYTGLVEHLVHMISGSEEVVHTIGDERLHF